MIHSNPRCPLPPRRATPTRRASIWPSSTPTPACRADHRPKRICNATSALPRPQYTRWSSPWNAQGSSADNRASLAASSCSSTQTTFPCYEPRTNPSKPLCRGTSFNRQRECVQSSQHPTGIAECCVNSPPRTTPFASSAVGQRVTSGLSSRVDGSSVPTRVPMRYEARCNPIAPARLPIERLRGVSNTPLHIRNPLPRDLSRGTSRAESLSEGGLSPV